MYNVEEGEITAQETRNREAFKEGKPLFFAHPTDTGFKLAAACTNKNHKWTSNSGNSSIHVLRWEI